MKLETAARLYKYRKANGYSQEELADKIGVSRQAISKWERSESSPDTDNLIALSELYGVSIDELLNGKKEPSSAEYQSKNNYCESKGNTAGANEQNKNSEPQKSAWIHAFLPIAVVLTYLLLGFTVPRGWACGWLLFFIIPIAETIFAAIKTKNPCVFAFPVAVTAWYLTGGMLWGAWHPQWILFLTIPIYYIGCETYKKIKQKRGEKYNYAECELDKADAKKGNNAVAIIGMIICAVTIISVVGILSAFNFLSAFNIDNFLPKFSFGSINSHAVDISYEDSSKYSVGNGETSAKGINSIDIDWVSGNIKIEYYGGETIRFTEPNQENSDYKLRYLANGDELKIKFCKSGMKNLPDANKELLIQLPKSFSINKLNIDNVSSQIEINGISVKELVCNTVSGEINALGNIKNISVNGVSAEVNIKTDIAPESVKIDTISGSSSITVPAETKGFELNFNSVSGKYELNNFELPSCSGKNAQWGDKSTKIDYNSLSGNLSLTKTNN